MAREATVFYKRLAHLLAEKRNEEYSMVMGWLRCAISFSLLKAATLLVRGTRKSTQRNFDTECLAEATAAGRLTCPRSIFLSVSTIMTEFDTEFSHHKSMLVDIYLSSFVHRGPVCLCIV